MVDFYMRESASGFRNVRMIALFPQMIGRLALASALCSALSFAQAPSLFSPAQERSAKAVQVNGQVSVLKDNSPWALQPGDWVNLRQVIVTGSDGFAVFQINDGSTFEVYPNSRVIFRNNAGGWKDLLDLYLGRVKVHIQKFGGQPNPNRVTTPTAVISVRGTVFDVQIEDEDATTLVTVDEGQVAVRHSLLPPSEPKLLNAGEYVRVYKNQPLAQKHFDKGGALRRTMQAATDAYYNIMLRTPRGGGGSPTGSVPPGRPADTEATPPPPPPAAPPPPPPL
jgi:ferric-dicitrate binding protein FerR (iron transport regulator)